MTSFSRLTRFAPAVLLLTAAGCKDFLDVTPKTTVPAEKAIVDATSARSAASGIYDAMQSLDYYGGTFTEFGDLIGDDVIFTGTFSTYGEADANEVRSDNTAIQGIWDAIYDGINRANTVIAVVPNVGGLSDDERAQIVGEAYFARALMYHDLVRVFGGQNPTDLGVPIRLTPTTSISETFNVSRATVAAVYAQINADLNQAETFLPDNGLTRRASPGAVLAIRARVQLYQKNYAGALASADAAISGYGYRLAPRYSDLFTADGSDTPEDIFRLTFTPQDSHEIGFYYQSRTFGGRREIAPSAALRSLYEATDFRRDYNISFDPRNRRYGSKYPTPIGSEDLHVIRLGEVLLIKAEAEANLNQLPEAVTTLNLIRARAGATQYVFGAPGATTPQEIINLIVKERRLELAFEGHRFPDLVRLGLFVSVLTAFNGYPVDASQTRYPIPQAEIDVTGPSLQQNPGY
jgi:hypothetical protein